ncbi:hypothetical protein FRC03_000980 [Tulasnella sp. 419]|nr:hypothetical protein FRC03_000980 [Tulasnella sp. 419]
MSPPQSNPPPPRSKPKANDAQQSTPQSTPLPQQSANPQQSPPSQRQSSRNSPGGPPSAPRPTYPWSARCLTPQPISFLPRENGPPLPSTSHLSISVSSMRSLLTPGRFGDC